MSTNIRFKRSDVPGKVPSLEALELGELAINSADGKLFTKQEIKQPAGFAAIQKIVEIGATAVPNVLYVSKGGDDSNSGKTLGESFASVKKALSIATPGTTIFLKSGEYIEDNPLRVPARVSIVGDNLRNTTVRPKNPTKDIFWVYNGAYIFCMNFKGHIAPSAAVCFPPDGSAGEIVTSPYTQAVTSITTTGTGMRVDGAVTTGLRSMVVDAFTQYNQGGVGIHMLNRGNTQLVSVFTICCDISFLCEGGGFCSINLSNSSFGNYGLVSRGASEILYRGVVKKSAGRQITFKNLAKRPNIGDGVLFANYNQATCNRDNGLVVDSLAQDLLYEGTTQSTFAGLRYWAKGEITIGDQGPETVAALDHAKYVAGLITRDTAITATSGNTETQVRASTLGVSAGTSTPQRLVRDGFAIVSGIVKNGPLSPQTIILPDYDLAEPELKRLREQVLSKKAEIQDQTIAFVKTNYPTLQYAESKCFRDVGIIIDAVVNDMIFGGNYLSIKAARTYINTNGLVIPANTTTATVEAVKFARDKVIALLTEDTTATTRATANFALITSSIDAGAVTAAPEYPEYQDTNVDIKNLVANLQANKVLVETIITDYVNTNYPELVGNYSVSTCRRDIGYVLDAMCFDLAYGGNSETLDSAKRYYGYANGSRQIANAEKAATTDAYGLVQLYSQRVVILDPIEGRESSQIFAVGGKDLVATNQTQVNNLGRLFKLFLKQIDSEIVGTSDFIQSNGAKLVDADLDNAYKLLQANKSFLKAEVIAYLTRSFPAFNYDRVKCARDIGYIVDSVCFDMTHGGNRQAVQSGIYYYGFNSESNVLKTVSPRQINQTVNAYLYLKELLADVITCTPRPNPWQGTVEQRTSLPPATVAESYALNNLIDVIVEILREGPNNSEDSIQRTKQAIGLTASTDPNKLRAFDLLLANKEFIQAELSAYININWYEISDGDNTFARVSTATPLSLGTTTTGYPVTTYQPTAVKAVRDAILAAKEDITTETTKFMANNFFDNFSFNKPKCYRDVGLILDAILSDMVFDSNYKTINAAISYFRAYASDVIGPQKVQTVAALKAAKILTLERVVTPAAKIAIGTRFDILIGIIENENLGANVLEYPPLQRNSEEDIDRKTAVDILRDNIDFIKDEVISYIDSNFTVLSYDREKCARDVGIIVEALGYDLMFGSNFRSITAGRAYMRVNAAKVASGQKLATIGGFKQLKKLVAGLLKENTLATNSTDRNMDIVIDIVESDGMNVPKFIIPFPATGRDVGYKRARDLVEKNREFIISEILAYIDNPSNNTPVGYNEAKCERDLNLILDAVYYDITYGGTLETQTAAYSYFVGTINQLDPTGQNIDERTATVAAYTYLKSVISQVAIDTPVVRTTGNSTVQFRSPTGSDGSAAAASDMSDLIQLIVSYINATDSQRPTVLKNQTSTPDLTWVDTKLVAEFKKLQNATVTLKSSITSYIDENYVIFGYNRVKCARDVGLVVDAVRYDMMFGSNFRSITAGRSYWRAQASVVTKDQKVATMASFEFLKSKLLDLVKSNETATARVTSSMDIILSILENGPTAAPAVVWPAPTAFDSGFANAKANLLANKEWAVGEIDTYLTSLATSATETPVDFVYTAAQKANCQRDVRFIIDAIVYDMTYGGCMESSVAGRAYYAGANADGAGATLISGDGPATALAYEQLATTILPAIVKLTGTGVVTTVGSTTLTAGSDASRDRAKALAKIIKAYVNGSSDAVALAAGRNNSLGGDSTLSTDGLPSTDWVANALFTLNQNLVVKRTDLGSAVTDFVDSNYAYNKDKCSRDVGFLIDAMCYDVLYGGNVDTVSAAQSYFDGAIVPKSIIPKQVIQTVAAYERLKEVLQDVVQLKEVTPSSKKFLATDSVSANMDLIKNILDNGEAVAPKRPFALPLPKAAYGVTNNSSDNGFLNARNLIAANREFLKAEVIAYIEANSPPTYNKETCKRDVDYILDAVYYDMTYGGNMETIVAGRAYYDGTSIGAGERTATTNAYTRLKAAIIAVAQNNDFTKTTANAVSQVKSTGANLQAGSSAAATAAGLLIDNIITFLDTNTGNNANESLANTSWVDSGLVAVSDALATVNAVTYTVGSNTFDGIQKQVTDYITANYSGLTYTVSTCQRDIGLIIDAVRYDLMFGTNFRSTVAGRSYSRSQVTNGNFTTRNQKEATLAAIDFTKGKILEVIAANAVTQTTTSNSAGSDAARDKANALIGIVLNAINETNTNPTPVAAGTDWVNVLDSELVTISNQIDTDRNTIKSAITDYIDLNYSDLVYDDLICARDVGLVIDAVRYDMMFGSNFRSIIAARSYYRSQASKVVGEQKAATTRAFELLKTKLLTYTTISDTATARVAECMDIVLSVLEMGLDALPEVRLPSPTGYNTTYLQGYGYARNLIDANRAFIKAELTKKITVDYPSLDYDNAVCLRDVDYIIDALRYDMTYGGTMESCIAAKAYYQGTDPADALPNASQKAATVAAYTYLQTLVTKIAKNQDVSKLQVKVPQVFGSPAGVTAAQTGRNLAWTVRDYISTVAPNAKTVYPDTAWAGTNLSDFAELLGKYKTENLVASVTDTVRRPKSLPQKVTDYAITNFGNQVTQIAVSGAGTNGDPYVAEFTVNSDHAYSVGQAIQFIGATPTPPVTIPGNLKYSTTYYVKQVVSARVFRISERKDLANNTVTTLTSATITPAAGTPKVSRFDTDKCDRDTALVLDALRFDIAFDTNFKTIIAAKAYKRSVANNLNATQKAATVAAFTQLKSELQTLNFRAKSTSKTAINPEGTAGSGNSNNAITLARINTLMDLFISHIDTNAALPAKPYTIPTPTGANSVNTPLNAYDRNTLAARTAIENNREFVKAEVIAWIDDQNRRNTSGFTTFAYNRTKCLEDLDYILDAIYYDLTYGGNTETVNAGVAYYEGAVLGADEITATERAYNYLGTVLFNIARNTEVESFQLAIPQVRGIGASAQVAAKLAGLTDIVINVVKGGVKQLPEKIDPEFLAGDETLAYVRSSLQEQKKSLQARIADYLDSFILQYNTEKCARDVGLIIDCVMYDLVLNSNFQTITAGSVYLQKAAGVVTSYQLGPQLEAINFIKEKCVAVSQTPPLVTNPYIISEIENRFDILYDIVDKGVEVAPAVVNVPPLGAAFNPNSINAAKSLIANKEFLKEEVTAYITANYKTYDQSRCARDVGLIIDAALNDLLLGTNFNSIKAGTAYRRATSSLVISDQLTETLGGIDYALSLVLQLTTDANAIASITGSFELIKSIIGQNTVPNFVTPLAGGSVYALPRATGRDFRNAGYFDVVSYLKNSTNVAAIKAAVSAFITDQINSTEPSKNPAFTGFSYDTARQASCEQDIGYILEAMCYDLTYGGNMETMVAGRAYYAGAANESLLVANEIKATLEAYTFMGKFIFDKLVAAGKSADISREAETLVLDVRNLIDAAYNSSPETVTPFIDWVDSDYLSLDGEILSNKETLKTQIVDYVNSATIGAGYSQSNCSRDLGYILDAVFYDMVTNSNYQTITAGLSYRRLDASGVLSTAQKFATVNALKHAIKLSQDAISDTTAKARVKTGLQTVLDIIADSGATDGPITITYPYSDVTVSAAAQAAGSALQTNKAAIKTAITTFLSTYNYNGTGAGKFWTDLSADKKATCARDVGYIVDALTYDLTYGGNWASVINARAYFAGTQSQLDRGTANPEEKAATLAAYEQLKTVVDTYVEDAGLVTTAGGLIDVIKNYIGGNGTSPALTAISFPTLTGANAGLKADLDTYNNGTTKANIVTALINYINARDFLVFDSTKCARDVGLIIDAVRYDMLFNTTFRSIVAGRSYQRAMASNVYGTGAQNDATYAAITELRAKLVKIVGEYAAAGINAAAQARVINLVDIVRNIIGGDSLPTFDVTTTTAVTGLPTPTDGTANAHVAAIANAKARIIANKAFLKEEVIAYIKQEKTADRGNFNTNTGDTYRNFVFGAGEETKCRRDLDYILDAIIYDLTYGGNLETTVAGQAYYNGTVLDATKEKLATLDAYRHLRDVIKLVVENQTVTPSASIGGGVTQNTGGTPTTDTVRDNFVAPLVTLVMNFIDTNPQDPVETPADITWVPSKLYVFSDALNAAKATVAKTTTDYITANYPALDYNVATCQRDIGLVIDAVRWDMMFNSNFRSSVAGRSYLRRQVAQGGFTTKGQKDASVQGFKIVKLALEDIVKSDATALARVGASMDVVIDVLDNGAGRVRTFGGSGALALSIPYGGTVNSFDNGYLAARDRIEANRDFIKAEVIAYIDANSPPTYSKVTCARDVDYVLDAVRYDLTYGGNLATVEAGYSYYDGTSIAAGEVTATVNAYERLRVILGYIAVNDNTSFTKTTTGATPNALTQVVTGLAGSATGAAAAQILIAELKTFIDRTPGASNNADPRLPNTSWVNSQFVSFATTMSDTVESLKQQVTDYVTATYPALTYDKDLCARDVGFVVDAVRYDMMFDNEFRSYIAGRSYARGQVLSGNFTTNATGSQRPASIAAFKFLKDKLLAIVTGNKEAGRRVTSAMRTLLDTIELGEVTRNSYDTVVASGISLLDANRASLLSQMNTYLNGISHSFAGYDQTTCLRDVGYVLDAIKYDLTYGGNMETLVAGRAYYAGAVLGSGNTDHKNATKTAFTTLSGYIAAISNFPASVAAKVAALIANVNSKIDNADVAEVYADASWADVNLKEVNATFRDQIASIKTAVTDYVSTNYPALTYDKVKCARDVGYVTDAISWDMLFNSNFRTTIAGRSYARLIASGGAFGANQKLATTAAFNYLKDQLLALTDNAMAKERVASGMNVVLQILDKGLNGSTPAITWGGTPVDTNADQVKQTLLANKNFIVDQVLAKINNDYNPFKELNGTVGYNEEKCARDVGYIVTAVAYDLVTGSNYQSTIAAIRYLGGSATQVLGAKEKHMTIQSLKYVKQLLASIVANNDTAVTAVKANMDLIINIINVGTNTVRDAALTAMAFPTDKVTSTAQTTLRGNRATIVSDVGSYLSSYNTGGFDWAGFTRQATCLRDVGYIVDAITYDLTYGGNWATTIAARAYYVGTSNVSNLGIPGAQLDLEKAATLAAYAQLKTLLASYTGAGAKIDIITNVITNGLSALPTVQYPALLGANNDLEIARNNLVNAVPTVSKKTTKYINERAYFDYDVVKCERDLGFIIDAVVYDSLTDSNYQSVTAGLAYTRVDAQGAVAAPQKFAILAALTHAKSTLANLVSTNSTVVSRIRSKLGIVIDIINDGGSAPALAFTTANLTGATTTNTLQANKETIKTAVGTYLSTYTVGGFSWSTLAGRQATCLRDVGYIVDALTHDLTYGGNRATVIAARSYFAGTQAQLGSGTGEKGATLAAYGQLKSIVATYVGTQSSAADTLIDIIINYVGGDGTTPALTAIIEPTVTSTNSTINSATATLVAAREASVNNVLGYINNREFIRGVYDQDKCARDVGLIIDAVAYDVALGSNFQSVKAGQAYLRSYSKTVIGEQKAATIGAMYFLKKSLSEIGSLGGSAKTSVRALMDIVIDILDRGVIAVPALTLAASTRGTGYVNAIATIASKADFIKAEIRAWIAIKYPELDYDKIACERDVDYILEALRYDLTYGGNSQTVEAGRAYWEGNVLSLGLGEINKIDPTKPCSELVATTDSENGAYVYLKDMIKNLIIEATFNSFVPKQINVVKGTFGATSDSTVQGEVDDLISDMIDIIKSANLTAAIATVSSTAPTVSNADFTLLRGAAKTTLSASSDATAGSVNEAIKNAFNGQWFVYNPTKCGRDIGYIVEALAYDMFYGGNGQTRDAGIQYTYKGGLVIPFGTKGPTILSMQYLASFIDDIVLNTTVAALSGNSRTQDKSHTAATADNATRTATLVNGIVTTLQKGLAGAPAPTVVTALDKAETKYKLLRDLVKDNLEGIQDETIKYINEQYSGFGYKQETCKRDIGLTLDAVAYDLIYGGNSRTKYAAEQYFSGGRLQIPADSKDATAACFNYLDTLARKIVKNDYVTPVQLYVDQNTDNVAATNSEVTTVASLFDAFTDIVSNGYISVVTLDATFKSSVDDNTYATFHQVSQITTTGHTLEWVGTGIDVDSALPYNGGVPIEKNEIVSINGGFINFTSTDQKGDFKIGPELTIKRDSGSIVGRAFNKSLLGVITPYILALNE